MTDSAPERAGHREDRESALGSACPPEKGTATGYENKQHHAPTDDKMSYFDDETSEVITPSKPSSADAKQAPSYQRNLGEPSALTRNADEILQRPQSASIDPESQAVRSEKRSQRAADFIRHSILVMLGALLGAALALAVVFSINGTLMYERKGATDLLQSRLNALDAEVLSIGNSVESTSLRLRDIESALDDLTSTVGNLDSDLENLGIRVAEVEGMRDQVEQMASQSQMLSEQVDALDADLKEISGRTAAFDSFLQELSKLLDEAVR